jgi:hypothetical protein
MIHVHVWSIYMYDLCTCMIYVHVLSMYMYDLCTCMIFRWVPKMRNASDTIVEKIKTHFKFGNFFPKIVPFMR